MTLSDFRRITDELLSAYIDGEVSEQERTLVEAAIAADEEIAWRMNSLRQTVNLLRDLPEVAMPRSFTLTLDQVGTDQADGQLAGATVESPVESAVRSAPKTASPRQSSPGLWGQLQQGWREFWQAGNPVLRNAAAVSFVLMLIVAGGGPLLNSALTQPAGMTASAPAMDSAAAPASSEAATSEVVALAPTASPDSALQAQDEESAAIMQADAVTDEEIAASDSAESAESAGAAGGVVEESIVAEEETGAEEGETATEPTPEAQIAEAQMAEPEVVEDQAAAEDQAEATGEEPAAAAAMVAPPEAMPEADGAAPLLVPEQAPFPGGPVAREQGGDGMGNGMGGGGPEGPGVQMAPGMEDSNMGFPPEAYTFDADQLDAGPMEPTVVPAEEAVSASVAAAPTEEASAEAPAEMPATPAVDAPAAQGASVVTATNGVGDDAAATGETVVEPTVEPTTEPTVESTAPATTETAEAVALAAPENITRSTVVQDAPADDAVEVTGAARNLPVVWVAQGSTIFLTIMLVTLWWRSRRRTSRPRNR